MSALLLLALACSAPPPAPATPAIPPEMIRLELRNLALLEAESADTPRWPLGEDAAAVLALRDERGGSRPLRREELGEHDPESLRQTALAELERELGEPGLEASEEAGVFRLIIARGPPPADALLLPGFWAPTQAQLGGELFAIAPTRGEVQLGGPGAACALAKRIDAARKSRAEPVSHAVFQWSPAAWTPVADPCGGA